MLPSRSRPLYAYMLKGNMLLPPLAPGMSMPPSLDKKTGARNGPRSNSFCRVDKPEDSYGFSYLSSVIFMERTWSPVFKR